MVGTLSRADLTVLTLNLQQGKPPEQFAAGLAEIAALCPDVVLVQEADRGSLLSGRVDHTGLVAAACGLEHWQFLPGRSTWATVLPFLNPRRKDVGENGTGVGIASRYPATWHAHHLETKRPLPRRRGFHVDMDQPRQVLAATLAVGDTTVTVASTHLSWHEGVGEDQLRQVEDFLQTLPGPWILGGDFNQRTNVSIWPSLCTGATYPAHRPRFQLDYLVSDLPALRAEIHRFSFSDHRGVLAAVSISDEGQ